jgi:hypothetical protein
MSAMHSTHIKITRTKQGYTQLHAVHSTVLCNEFDYVSSRICKINTNAEVFTDEIPEFSFIHSRHICGR